MADAENDIAYLRRVVENSRHALRIDALPLVIWGLLTGVGATLSYAVPSLDSVWLWVLVIGLAWLYTGYRLLLRTDEPAALAFSQHGLAALWFALLTTMTVIGFGGVFSGGLEPADVPPVVAAMLGAGCVASSRLIDRPRVGLLGVAWWCGAVLLFLVPGHLAMALFGTLVLLLLTLPAWLLHRSRPPQ